ncbi:endonuclease domain-containing protein [Heyndrickxia sp. MSNUG]|uniref:endonuclease domain-containing protein n=1 Tax=Heyndrickxia sp. MSNUG TaxID=3136677 RepID=UPI003C2BD24B
MIEYIIFFSMLAAGVLMFVFRRKEPPMFDTVTMQRMKCESPIERRLFDALVFRGYTVSTQVPCGKYRIDLALVGPRIAIECDGKAYHSSPEQKAHDRRKDAFLRKNGWKVLRFSGRQITRGLHYVLDKIEKEVRGNS